MRSDFKVLVICPFNKKITALGKSLRGKGLRNVNFIEEGSATVSNVLDICQILAEDPESNLGWRLAAEHWLDESELSTLVKATGKSTEVPIIDYCNVSFQMKVKDLVRIFKKFRKGADIKQTDCSLLLSELQLDEIGLLSKTINSEVSDASTHKVERAIRNIQVDIATVAGSKGLSADVVFLTHCDDKYMLSKGRLTDISVCSFMVALTRAKSVALLISTSTQGCQLVKLIDQSRLRVHDYIIKKKPNS